MTPIERNFASQREIASALTSLSDADLLRLELFAKFRAVACPWLDWQDLINETFERCLSGSRRWPSDISFLVFLRETIRSIASEEIRSHAERPVVTESDLPRNALDEPSIEIDQYPDGRPGQDRAVLATQLVEDLLAKFEGDEQAKAIMEGLALGLSPSEVCQRAKITRTQYASAQRRIRRRLAWDYKETKA